MSTCKEALAISYYVYNSFVVSLHLTYKLNTLSKEEAATDIKLFEQLREKIDRTVIQLEERKQKELASTRQVVASQQDQQSRVLQAAEEKGYVIGPALFDTQQQYPGRPYLDQEGGTSLGHYFSIYIHTLSLSI